MAKSKPKTAPKSSATRADSIRAWQASRTPEQRAESARKAAAAREAKRQAGTVPKTPTRTKRQRSQAARKGWQTRRAQGSAPPPPAKRPKQTPGQKARSDAARKGWQTRRAKEARRRELGEQLIAAKPLFDERDARIDAERAARRAAETAGWSSELTYFGGAGAGSLGEWAREVIETARADAGGAPSPGWQPTEDWRIQGAIDGAEKGAGAFDARLSGTLHERAEQLIAILGEAAQKGGVTGVGDDSPDKRDGGTKSKGRAARPLDAAAQAEKDAALARHQASSEPGQAWRAQTLLAPIQSPIWAGQGDPEEPEGEHGHDDEVPF